MPEENIQAILSSGLMPLMRPRMFGGCACGDSVIVVRYDAKDKAWVWLTKPGGAPLD